jgi:histone deacetylase 1/2
VKRIFSLFVACTTIFGTSTAALSSSVRNPASSLKKAVFHSERINSQYDGTLNKIHHAALAVAAGDNDTYTLKEMLKQEDSNDFVVAMVKEVEDHEKRDHWTLIPRSTMPEGTKTILSIWSFKRKRFPDGRVLKHKARLCAHGGMQTWGVNYWETYAPVVNWFSVRTLMVLSILNDLETRSIDFVLAFPQADLDVDIYMELPFGFDFEGKRGYVLKLNKNLYGLKDASRTFWNMLSDGLTARGYAKQSAVDSYVFIGEDSILLCYVDDCIIIQRKGSSATDDLIKALQEGREKFTFTDDGDLNKYLGVDVKRHKDGSIELTQSHLIQRFLDVIGIDDKHNPRPTPAVKPVLSKDPQGEPRKHDWNYHQAVGMLTYLQGTTRPELAMAVHQCARFCIDPKLLHERAINRIGKYLQGTKDKGIIYRPDLSKGLECYVDADFAGGWNKDENGDADTVLSRTGYVIMYAGCPIIWCSKLQTEIALSTVESEYMALSQALREVIPMMVLLHELKEVFPTIVSTPKIHCKVWEDNQGCLSLAKEGKFSPRTKHIAIKYHHFRSKVQDGSISIHSIDTKEQTADIFTKPLDEALFIYLRFKLCGW